MTSSRYISKVFHCNPLSTSSMQRSNVLGALQSPNVDVLYRPLRVTKAVLGRSSSFILICQYPDCRSSVLKILAPLSWGNLDSHQSVMGMRHGALRYLTFGSRHTGEAQGMLILVSPLPSVGCPVFSLPRPEMLLEASGWLTYGASVTGVNSVLHYCCSSQVLCGLGKSVHMPCQKFRQWFLLMRGKIFTTPHKVCRGSQTIFRGITGIWSVECDWGWSFACMHSAHAHRSIEVIYFTVLLFVNEYGTTASISCRYPMTVPARSSMFSGDVFMIRTGIPIYCRLGSTRELPTTRFWSMFLFNAASTTAEFMSIELSLWVSATPPAIHSLHAVTVVFSFNEIGITHGGEPLIVHWTQVPAIRMPRRASRMQSKKYKKS